MNTERRLAASALSDPNVLFGFMRRTRKPVFHKSNLFVRDIQHAVRDYCERVARTPLTAVEAERIARTLVEAYMISGVLRPVDNQAYVLNMPAFGTPAAGTYAMLTLHGAPLPGRVGAK